MSTETGSMGFSGRPALFTFWTVTVSVLAAAALILSAVALSVAGRDDRSVASVEGGGTREAVVALSPANESLILAYDRALLERDRLLKEWDRSGVLAGNESLTIAYDRALRQRDRLLKEAEAGAST